MLQGSHRGACSLASAAAREREPSPRPVIPFRMVLPQFGQALNRVRDATRCASDEMLRHVEPSPSAAIPLASDDRLAQTGVVDLRTAGTKGSCCTTLGARSSTPSTPTTQRVGCFLTITWSAGSISSTTSAGGAYTTGGGAGRRERSQASPPLLHPLLHQPPQRSPRSPTLMIADEGSSAISRKRADTALVTSAV